MALPDRHALHRHADLLARRTRVRLHLAGPGRRRTLRPHQQPPRRLALPAFVAVHVVVLHRGFSPLVPLACGGLSLLTLWADVLDKSAAVAGPGRAWVRRLRRGPRMLAT
jgi:hypothetical protein